MLQCTHPSPTTCATWQKFVPPYSPDTLRISAFNFLKALGAEAGVTLLKIRTNSSLKPFQYNWNGHCPYCRSPIAPSSWNFQIHIFSQCPAPGLGHMSSLNINFLCTFSLLDLENIASTTRILNTLRYVNKTINTITAISTSSSSTWVFKMYGSFINHLCFYSQSVTSHFTFPTSTWSNELATMDS